MNILVFIGGTVAGILIIRYVRWIYGNVSRLPFFERYLGYGGGYTGWRIIGVLVIGLSWYLSFTFFK